MRAMSAYEIVRPVWRRFRARFLARAAAHVRRGGHAAVEVGEVSQVSGPSGHGAALDMLLTVDAAGKITELGLWSILAIEQQRWRRVKVGPAAGLATARVRAKFVGSVLDWCERDSIHEGATRTIHLDCLDCGACCHEANVVLDEADFDRWREAGRKDLLGRAYLKRADGKVTLRFAASGRCQNLGRDNKCAIYAIRPDNCSAFVVGSEACLAAREDTLRLRDGLEAQPDDG
jgi:Fe-S-cluster containining protein